MENPLNQLGHADDKHKILIAVGGLIIIAVIIVAIRSLASSGGGSVGTITGSGGGSTGTSDSGTGTPSLADQLGYQQGLADIQNQSATLGEQLQEQLASSQEALSEKNTSFVATIQEQLTTFNNAATQTQIGNTINQLIDGQKAADTLANAELQATDAIAADNTANILTKFFTHDNGQGLSGSGGPDKNLSLSDAIGAYIKKYGASGSTFLTTFVTDSQPSNQVQATPPNSLQSFLNTTANSIGGSLTNAAG